MGGPLQRDWPRGRPVRAGAVHRDSDRGHRLIYASNTCAHLLTWSPSASSRKAKSPGSTDSPCPLQSRMSANAVGDDAEEAVAGRAEDAVGPRAADEDVEAPLAEQAVIAVAAEHRVVLGVADQHVGAVAADDVLDVDDGVALAALG